MSFTCYECPSLGILSYLLRSLIIQMITNKKKSVLSQVDASRLGNPVHVFNVPPLAKSR